MSALPADFVRPARACFLDAFVVKRPIGAEKFRYVERHRFYSKTYDCIFEVPVDYETNFVTGREFPGIAWLAGTLSEEASGLHDRLYETAEVPREVADAVFLEALEAVRVAVREAERQAEKEKGAGVIRRSAGAIGRGFANVLDFLKHRAMYIGVRAFGESRYNGPKPAPAEDIYRG